MIETRCRLLLGLIVVVAICAIRVGAAEKGAVVVAVQVKGTVEVQHAGASGLEKVTEGRQLAATDIVTTAKGSSVVLALENGSFVSLREKSRLKITTALQSTAAEEQPAAKGAEPQESGSSKSSFELEFGEMLARVRKLNPSSTFEVQTPVSVAAVRGTVFEVSYRPDESGPSQYRLSTASGLVHVTPHGGELVKVAAAEQMEFAARIRGARIRLQPIKTTKLSPQKHGQLEKEAQETERNAADVVKRAQAAAVPSNKGPARVDDKTKDVMPDKPKDAGSSPRDAAKDVTPNTPKVTPPPAPPTRTKQIAPAPPAPKK